MAGTRSTECSRIIYAARETIYEAFLDGESVASWLPPGNMTGIVHAFDGREGGVFSMSLIYPEHNAGRGKSDARTDTFKGHFAKLVPNQLLVWVTQFDSSDPLFAGEMIVITALQSVREGTQVTMRCDHIPPGVRLEDNEAGTRLSLEQLASFVGG